MPSTERGHVAIHDLDVCLGRVCKNSEHRNSTGFTGDVAAKDDGALACKQCCYGEYIAPSFFCAADSCDENYLPVRSYILRDIGGASMVAMVR